MTQDKIELAVVEAKRFIAKADALKARRKVGDLYEFQGCKESGAVRRASIDLTRALTEMRQP